MAKASERDRYKYGVCTNRDKDGKPCPKCESKEVQKTRMGQDFICEECKEPMRQVPPPKPPTNWVKIIVPIVAVLLIGGGIFFMVSQKEPDTTGEPVKDPIDQPEEPKEQEEERDTVQITIPEGSQEVVVNEEPKGGSTTTVPTSGTGKLNVPGGIYQGDIRNGKPHGNGTITYSKRTLIDDLKQRYAEPEDYVTGLFREGKIVNVKWYDKNGEFKETVIPG